MNSYLIPANSKKSMLIFGLFDTFDLILFLIGLVLSFGMMMLMPVKNLFIAVIVLLPLGLATFLVFPIPNYHNVRTVLVNAWNFYTTRQKYVWKGWCFDNGEDDKK